MWQQFEGDAHSSNYISLRWKHMMGSLRLSCQECLSLAGWDKFVSEEGKIALIQNVLKAVLPAIQWVYSTHSVGGSFPPPSSLF